MVKALWNTFFSKRRAGPSIRPVLTGHFLTFQSFCFGLIYNIWNSLNVKPQYPSSNKNQKRDTKKTLQFLSTDTPCHHLLFQNDLTMKEWSSGSHSTGHHMLITNLSLQLCRIRKHWKWNHIKCLHMQMSLPLGGVFLGKKKKRFGHWLNSAVEFKILACTENPAVRWRLRLNHPSEFQESTTLHQVHFELQME